MRMRALACGVRTISALRTRDGLDDPPRRTVGVHRDQRQRGRQAEPGELLAVTRLEQGLEV